MKAKSSQFETIFTTHINLTKERKEALQNIVQALVINPSTFEFRHPLNAQERGLIDYHQVIQMPMDLSTVKKNLQKDLYHSVENCLDDIELIFQNSQFYNKGNLWIQDLTTKCQKAFLKLVRNYLPEVKSKKILESKKTLKNQKILEKKQKILEKNQEIFEKSMDHEKKQNDYKKISIQKFTDKTEPKQSNEQTQTAIIKQDLDPEKKDSQQNEEEMVNLRKELFDIILQASERSLQVTYLIVKNENPSWISTDKNGNCSIDVRNLPKQFIIKIINFLKEEKERDQYQKLKQTTKKPKKKIVIQRSRFEI